MKHNRKRGTFINSIEVLLHFNTTSRSVPYIAETAPLGQTVATAAEAIAGCDDGAAKFIRYDTEVDRGEDVTEECAAAYLDSFDGEPTDFVPPFVQFSEAWEDWCEDFYRRDRRQPYSTHNVVQLGLTSAVARV